MYIVSVCLRSFSRMVGAIFLWYSYTWTLTFNGGRGSRATCCLKKLILSLSKCFLDTRLVLCFLCFFSVRLLSVSLIGYGSAYNNYVHTCLKRTYKQNNCGLRPDIRVAIMLWQGHVIQATVKCSKDDVSTGLLALDTTDSFSVCLVIVFAHTFKYALFHQLYATLLLV